MYILFEKIFYVGVKVGRLSLFVESIYFYIFYLSHALASLIAD